MNARDSYPVSAVIVGSNLSPVDQDRYDELCESLDDPHALPSVEARVAAWTELLLLAAKDKE